MYHHWPTYTGPFLQAIPSCTLQHKHHHLRKNLFLSLVLDTQSIIPHSDHLRSRYELHSHELYWLAIFQGSYLPLYLSRDHDLLSFPHVIPPRTSLHFARYRDLFRLAFHPGMCLDSYFRWHTAHSHCHFAYLFSRSLHRLGQCHRLPLLCHASWVFWSEFRPCRLSLCIIL